MTSGPPSTDVTTAVDAVGAALDARRHRAVTLAPAHAPTAEPLGFYAAVLGEQRRWLDGAARVVRDLPPVPPSERLPRALDTAALAAIAVDATRWLEGVGPPSMRDAATALTAVDVADWQARLESRLVADLAPRPDRPAERQPPHPQRDAVAAFVCDAVIQPFAEVAVALAGLGPDRFAAAEATVDTRTCPGCGDAPVVGLLLERGHGAGRALVCGRCASQWPAPRVVCPACGGMEVERLPVFRAEVWPAARLDACEACRTYVKSFDLTVDGSAIAVVDDVATLALDLWAAEHGFSRLRPNLLCL